MKFTLKFCEPPRVVSPANAEIGLYMELIREATTPIKDYHDALKATAALYGYDPEGRGFIGPPCTHGISTVTHAVWFYERAS